MRGRGLVQGEWVRARAFPARPAGSVPTPCGQRPLLFVHLTDEGGPQREASSLSLCLLPGFWSGLLSLFPQFLRLLYMQGVLAFICESLQTISPSLSVIL